MDSSKLTPEQLDELETTVKDLYTNGNTDEQNEILQTWFTDPQYFPLTMQIIETYISNSSDSKLMLTHFALRSFCSLLDYIPLKLQDLKEISEWFLNIFISQIDQFISEQILIQAFCTTYAQLVIFGWHASVEFQKFVSPIQSESFWENIQKGSAAQWCGMIRLYTGVVEKMAFYHNLETKQVQAYKEEPLFECFDFAVKTLNIVLNQQLPSQFKEDEVLRLIEYSLQLLNSCLSFDYYLFQYDNVESTTIYLPKTWSLDNKLHLYEIADCLFQLYQASPPNLQGEFLKLIYLFASIHNDSQSKVIPDRLQYVKPFFIYISQNLKEQIGESIDNNENLPLIINIILKVLFLTTESDYKNLSKMESFSSFIETVSELTKKIFCVSFFLNLSDSIINILKFWELISKIINQCNKDLQISDSAIEKLKHPMSEIEAHSLEKYVLDESFSEPIRQIVQTVQPLIDQVVDSYIQLLNQVVQEQPEAAHEVLFADLSQPNDLMTLVLSISFNERKFYRAILNTFNELLSAYAEDPKNLVIELQLGLFAMIISPPVFQKVRSGSRNKIPKIGNFNSSGRLQQARSSPSIQPQTSGLLLSTTSFSFHSFISEPEGENIDLGFGHHDKSHFFITKEIVSEIENNPSAGSFENSSGDDSIESMLDESMIGIINLIQCTNELIQTKGFTENEYMEEIVIFLIKSFTYSALINHRDVNFLPKLVSENTHVENSQDLNKLFIQRIITSISTYSTNNHIISLAMDAIAQWKNSEAISNKTFFINELLSVYYSSLEEFFDSMRTKHNRVRFHQIIGQIINSQPEDQIFDTFFQRISQRYQRLLEEKDQNLALGLILDLRGLVSGTTQAYSLSFDFIFPKLHIFHQMALEYSLLVIPYLKFLSEFTDMKEGRICFPENSSNGFIMAKAAISFCIAFLENAPRSLDISSKGFYFTMRIMKNVFTSKYSYLGAMIAYNDPILVQLFTSFLNFAHVADFNDIVHYPRHLVQIVHLMNYLFRHFSDFIVDIDITFLQIALFICTFSDNTSDLETMDATVQVISRITNCCVKLLGTPKGQELFDNTRETFAKVLRMLENCIMKMRFSIAYQKSLFHYELLIKSTKDVLKMSPPNWPEVKQRLSLFLGSPEDDRVKNLINGLVSIE